MIVSLIAAVDPDRVIGKDNKLPWHLPADLKQFKQITTNHPVIMGRKTHESIGKPLPDRTNIVLTRQSGYEAPGCIVAEDPEEALAMAREQGADEVMVIGGATVYETFLPRADRIYLTVVHHRFDGDTYFPDLQADEWNTLSVRDTDADEKNPWPHSLYVLERKHAKDSPVEAPAPSSRYPRPPFLTEDERTR